MTQIDPGTSAWLRAHNDRTAFRLLLEHGPLTRAQLGELSGMSKPTAAQMLTRLERAELVHAVGEASGARGPAAVSYGVRADRVTGVAVSMLADSLQCELVDATGTAHPAARVSLDAADRAPERDIRRAIEAACAAAGTDAEAVELVMIGVQAAVWEERDTLSLTNTLPGWPTTGARHAIEDALGVSVTIENDVNLAAVAERASGVARDTRGFVLLWMGDGLGAAVDWDGVIHRGVSGSAGEVGYLTLPAPSGSGAVDATDLLGGPALGELLDARDGDYADALTRLAPESPALAAVADRIALVIDPVLAVLDPEMVVLGGPTGIAGGDALAARVSDRIAREAHPVLEVRASTTGSAAVLLGARHVLVERIRDRLESRILTG
jgi:predicted NBD/HSP70 family sugar kinase